MVSFIWNMMLSFMNIMIYDDDIVFDDVIIKNLYKWINYIRYIILQKMLK